MGDLSLEHQCRERVEQAIRVHALARAESQRCSLERTNGSLIKCRERELRALSELESALKVFTAIVLPEDNR